MVPPDQAADRTSPAIDIVVPVFGAAAELRRCLQSLALHEEPGQARLVLVLDGPQPAEVEAALRQAGDRFGASLTVLREPARRGFAACTNAAIASTSGDIVLLNSDTEVTFGWLDRMSEAAASATLVSG